jgi:hypothetical protein
LSKNAYVWATQLPSSNELKIKFDPSLDRSWPELFLIIKNHGSKNPSQSSSHPVVILAPLNSPMRRPSIKKSVYKHPKIKKFALNLQLRTIQVLTNDAQVLIFCLLILLLLYKNSIEFYPYDLMYGSKFICSTWAYHK